MRTTRIQSGEMPKGLIIGPTGCWVNCDVTSSLDSEGHTVYSYEGIWFENGEYELVQNNVLPSGEWTAQLRAITRNALYKKAEEMLAKCDEKIATDDKDGKWANYKIALYDYKAKVRATQEQAGYPLTVEYPEMPSI